MASKNSPDTPFPFSLYKNKPTAYKSKEERQLGPLSSIVEKVSSLFHTKEEEDLTGAGVTSDAHDLRSLLTSFFSTEVSTDRKTVAKRAWKMYNSDSRIAGGIDGLVSDSFIVDNEERPLRVTFPDKDETTKALSKWFERLKMPRTLQPMTKRALIEGDAFGEIIVDWSKKSVVDFRWLYSFTEGYKVERVVRNKKFVGYNQIKLSSNKRVASFAPWQIVHMKWNPVSGSYGRSLLFPEQANWQRIDDAEKDMAIARRVRAFLKFIHFYPGKSVSELEEIANQRKKSKYFSQLGVESDIYTSAEELETVDPRNDALSKIDDLEYREQKMFAALRRPRALTAGYGRYVNRATLDRQTTHYLPTLHDLNEMGTEAIEEIIKRQIVIKHNKLPKLVPFKVTWTDKTGEKLLDKTQRMTSLVGANLIGRKTAARELGYEDSVPGEEEALSAKEQTEFFNKLSQSGNGNGSVSDEVLDEVVTEVVTFFQENPQLLPSNVLEVVPPRGT